MLVSSDGDKQLPTIVFQNDEVKISRYVAEIRAMRQRAAQKQTVSQASRSKLGHKLCFAGEALHGKCGAAARKVLFASEEVPARLLRSVLTIWEQLLLRGRPREVPIVPCPHPPMLVYTDAQLIVGGVPRLGGFLCTPSDAMFYSSSPSFVAAA